MPDVDRASIESALASLPRGRSGARKDDLRRSLLHELTDDACWPWQGARYAGGYGRVHVPMENRHTTAHRYVWTLLFGPVADGFQVDHQCHDPELCNLGTQCPHRRCVNPRHLQAVTSRENWERSNSPSLVNARKTECVNGHPFTPENTYVDANGWRSCVTCHREWSRIAELTRPRRDYSRRGKRQEPNA